MLSVRSFDSDFCKFLLMEIFKYVFRSNWASEEMPGAAHGFREEPVGARNKQRSSKDNNGPVEVIDSLVHVLIEGSWEEEANRSADEEDGTDGAIEHAPAADIPGPLHEGFARDCDPQDYRNSIRYRVTNRRDLGNS